MAAVARDEEIIEQALCQCAHVYSTPSEFRTLTAFDRERGQFLLIDEGWNGYRRIHRVWMHVELRDSKVWIHEDGTEEGVANRLVTMGIPHERIVLGFHAPSLRSATEFAVA
jgi:hypothetical protein